MRQLLAVLIIAASIATAASEQRSSLELEHLASFARLYGVMRYFYPSDTAAVLDWNSFAVHGVRQVRNARDAKSFETALKTLVGGLGPRIEIGRALPPVPEQPAAEGPLIAWRYLGAAVAPPGRFDAYRAKRTNRTWTSATTIDGFVTLLQRIPAAELRGKTIRLRGQVRAVTGDGEGAAALWLRVDSADAKSTFFDNMGNRPIRHPEWREYSIEGTVADTAAEVFFGVMASGNVTADFDAIEMTVRGADGAWSSVAIADSGFEASASESEWRRSGTSKMAEVIRGNVGVPHGAQFARLAPPTAATNSLELFADAPPKVSAHVNLELASGLSARVPLALTEAEASAVTRAAPPRLPFGPDDPDTRIADIVIAWNVFRHFYPYWREVDVDWDARLQPHLALALAVTTREQHHDVLRQLVADLRDGHGNVVDTTATAARASLPVRFMVIERQLVIIASAVPAEAPVGAVVTSINGEPAMQRVAQAMHLASGTAQWKEDRAARELASCARGATITLSVEGGLGARAVRLQCDATQPPVENRPAPVAELAAGVWYVDLTRAQMPQISPELDRLARARAVVFDVRGYPTDAGLRILPHLIDAPEQDRWMHIAKIVGPFGQSVGWNSLGWNLKPATPRFTGTIVFLTDGRAISYAESVMGYVADRKLGTIIGSATAGANGNVATFVVPGGFRIAFTGMRVTGHDGQTPHHLAGVAPHIAARPTVAGLRDGRDEVLARALSFIDGR